MQSSAFDLRLEKFAYGSDALGRLADGRAAFVPFALPGETVRARSVEEKRGHVRAELTKHSPREKGACNAIHPIRLELERPVSLFG